VLLEHVLRNSAGQHCDKELRPAANPQLAIRDRRPENLGYSRTIFQLENGMHAIKRIVWSLRAEAASFALWILTSVPLQFGVWLRSVFLPHFFLHLGKGTEIQSGLRVTNPEKVSIGANGSFAQGVFITGGGGVRIGNWVGFGPDVKIWSVSHRFDDPDKPWLLQGWNQQPVAIEDDVWLGANVFVMPGVTIGKGAIVSACALVNKSVPPYAIAAGNPCRVVGWRKHPTHAAASDTPTDTATRVLAANSVE
jgi:acetyltransferase-like isoleucine patch superfamily enzyme